MPRRAEEISLVREGLKAAAVVAVFLPFLGAFAAFMVWKFLEVGQVDVGQTPGILWLVFTLGFALLSAPILLVQLQKAAGALAPSEVANFRFPGWAVGNRAFENTQRETVEDIEIIRFDYTYGLRRLWRDGEEKVSSKADPHALVAFGHGLYFCVLPERVPELAVWSRGRTWDVPWAETLIAGDFEVDPLFDEAFTVQGTPGAEALLDPGLQAFLLAHPAWNVEVCGDAVLAFQIPQQRLRLAFSGRTGDVATDPDKAVFWELVTHLRRAGRTLPPQR